VGPENDGQTAPVTANSTAECVQRESISPPRVSAPRRRARAVRWLAPVAAAAAAAGLIVGLSVAVHDAGTDPYPRTLPAGAPKHYVTLESVRLGGTKYVVKALVRSSATGAPISTVQLLRSQSFPQPLAITGAANDRAFLISLPGTQEILRLTADGHVQRLTRLPKITELDDIYGALLSPDGTEVVVPIGPPYSCKSCSHGIAMFSATTGVTRQWLLPRGDEDLWDPVNWPANGHEIFLSGGLGHGFRLLDVAGPVESLLASSRPIHGPNPLPIQMLSQGWVTYGGDSWLMPDDKTLFTAYARLSTARHGGSAGSIETARIFETSASTGRLVRVLATFSARVPSDAGIGCLPVSFGPSGVHVLMWFNNGFGRLDGRHFTTLPGPSKNLEPSEAAAW
jgi:hypothetical protein